MNRAFDIGGPDVYRYGQLMNGYAVEAGLPQRPIAALPVLTPWLAGQWVNLVTPIPRRLAVPIIESLQFDCVMREHDIDAVIPPPPEGLLPYRTAVRLALEREREGEVETSWRNAEVEGAPSDPLPSDPDWAGHTVYVDERERRSSAPPADLWRVIEGVGGENGWYSFPLAWALRGWVDKLTGGVGLRRGRRDPDTLHVGDAVDFWRVEAIERGTLPATARRDAGARVAPGSSSVRRRLRMPRARTTGNARCSSRRASRVGSTGGRSCPFHGVIFSGMANRITAEAEAEAAAPGRGSRRKVTKR